MKVHQNNKRTFEGVSRFGEPATVLKLHTLNLNQDLRKQLTTTYGTISIWVVIRNIHSKLEDSILVQAMSNEYYSKPH